MTTMVPRTLVCSSGVDRWLHLGLTGWHFERPLLPSTFVESWSNKRRVKFVSHILSVCEICEIIMSLRMVWCDPHSEILRKLSDWVMGHGDVLDFLRHRSACAVCCARSGRCSEGLVQKGGKPDSSHPSILFQSNSLGISNFEDFELSSFSIFQHLSAAQVVLSSSFLPPPSHGLGKALWVQHWDPCRDAKRYQGIPPAPVVSDVYRSIGLPSKRNPFCNLRHLRFLGFVHFDETCIMIFWLFFDCFWCFAWQFSLVLFDFPGWKNHKCLTGIFENRRFWNPSCSQWGRRGWLAPHAQQRIEAHCIQMSPKRILQRLKRLKIKRDNQKQFVWRKMRTLGPFNFHFGVNNIQYIHARHWMQTKPDQTWVGKCIQFVTQCLFHSPHRQHGNCAQDEPSDGWLHVDNWASCWESWSPNWKPPLGRLTRGKLNITRNSLDHYFKWLWIWTRRLWKLCQTCFKQPHVAWEEGKRGCGSC